MDIVALREELVEPLITAVRQALLDMTGIEVNVRSVAAAPALAALGDVCVGVALSASLEGMLLMSCSAPTAETLARRTLADAGIDLNPALVADCLGELTNVVAGQAKALLHGGPYHFVFGTPTVVAAHDLQAASNLEALVITFDTEAGDVVLQLGKQR